MGLVPNNSLVPTVQVSGRSVLSRNVIHGTLITVAASYIPFGHRAVNIGVALFIACGKGFLVAGYFMHLISERKMVYGILVFTAFFFVGLMFLTIWSLSDFPFMTTTH